MNHDEPTDLDWLSMRANRSRSSVVHITAVQPVPQRSPESTYWLLGNFHWLTITGSMKYPEGIRKNCEGITQDVGDSARKLLGLGHKSTVLQTMPISCWCSRLYMPPHLQATPSTVWHMQTISNPKVQGYKSGLNPRSSEDTQWIWWFYQRKTMLLPPQTWI